MEGVSHRQGKTGTPSGLKNSLLSCQGAPHKGARGAGGEAAAQPPLATYGEWWWSGKSSPSSALLWHKLLTGYLFSGPNVAITSR